MDTCQNEIAFLFDILLNRHAGSQFDLCSLILHSLSHISYIQSNLTVQRTYPTLLTNYFMPGFH